MRINVNARFLTQKITGAQRYALEVGARLPAYLGEPLTLYTPRRPQQLSLAGELKPVGSLKGHLWEQLELSRAVEKDRLLFSPVNVGPLAVKHQVVTLHDVFSIKRPEWVTPAFHHWYSFLLPRLARRVEHIVTVSNYSKGMIIKALNIPADKVSVIPLGVDKRFRPASPTEIEQVREHFALPEHFILTLGSLESRKNLAGVMAAWSNVPAHIKLPLVIAGNLGVKAVYGNFDTQTLQSEGVQQLGYIPDELVPALYSAASLFVYPSFEEGFGIPPIEALACGTSVITSNTSAMKEFCQDYATLIDPYNTGSITEAMMHLLEIPESPELRHSRAQTVSKRFSWKKNAEQLATILQRYA